MLLFGGGCSRGKGVGLPWKGPDIDMRMLERGPAGLATGIPACPCPGIGLTPLGRELFCIKELALGPGPCPGIEAGYLTWLLGSSFSKVAFLFREPNIDAWF